MSIPLSLVTINVVCFTGSLDVDQYLKILIVELILVVSASDMFYRFSYIYIYMTSVSSFL